VRVAAQPERGRANEAVLGLIADALGLPQARVRLVAGHAARDKVVEVEGMSADDAERLLSAKRRKGDA
jgi:uncharacterized protein YggU (UPF0235/DUF167 family)